MVCKFCGAESDEKNCPKCGMPMIIQPQKPQPPQQPMQPQQPLYAPQQPMQPQQPLYAPPQPMQPPQQPPYAPPQQPMQPQQPPYAPPQQPMQPQQPPYAPPQRPMQPQQPPYAPPKQAAPVGGEQKPMTHLQVINMQYAGKKPPSPLKLKNVFWSAIALLLPLAFLFFELFAFLSPALGKGDALQEVFHAAANSQYESVTIGELVELETGEGGAFFEDVSALEVLKGLSQAEAEQLLPVGAVALFAVACAALGLLILFSCGKILKLPLVNTLLALFGAGATFAPLLGMLTLQVYYMADLGLDRADAAMARVAATPEALITMLILCCTVLPALASLRRLAARADGKPAYPLFPLRALRQCPHSLLKYACVALLAVALAFPILYVCLPIFGDVSLLDYLKAILEGDFGSYFKGLFQSLGTCFEALFGGAEGDVSVYLFLLTLGELLLLVVILVLALVLLHGLISLLRTVFLKESAFSRGKSAEKLCRSLRTRARNAVLTPYVCLAVFRVMVVSLLLFATPLFLHFDLGNVEESMNTYYLAVFYAKGVIGLTSVFSLIALGGAVLWHLLNQCALALVARGGKKNKTF